MSEKHKNLLILLLSCSLLICLIMMFALLPRDGGIEVEKMPEKDSGNKVFESFRIYDGHNLGVIYAENDNNCLDKDGRAVGDCYAEGLEDKRFLAYTEGVSDVGPISYVLLGTDGDLYYVDGPIAGINPTFDGKVKTSYGKEAEKIGFILSDETDECISNHVFVVVVDGEEYLLSEKGKTVLDTYAKDHIVDYVYSYTCGERPNKGLGYNAYKNLLNIDKKIVKDKEDKKEIVIDYIMYDDKERENVYIVGNGNLYLLENEDAEYAKVIGKVSKVHTIEEDVGGVLKFDTNVTIELEDGSVYAFINK